MMARPLTPETTNLRRKFFTGLLSASIIVAEPKLLAGEPAYTEASSAGVKVRTLRASVAVGVNVAVAVGVAVGVFVGVGEGPTVGVFVAVKVGVEVCVFVGVGVFVGVFVGLGVLVEVGVGFGPVDNKLKASTPLASSPQMLPSK